MSIFGWMYPLMGGLGAAAILSPIIIHLLNKRRFKIVEWAAMDFLFEADKKNRRRVRLENFILLLLRCLIMLLIGLILARPFFSSAVNSLFSTEQRFEHIVLLDDSLSQRVQVANKTGMERAVESVKQLLDESARNDRDDWISVYLTSDPERPLIDNEPVDADTLSALFERMDQLEVSDQAASYDESLQVFEGMLEGEKPNVNRIVYVMTDLRARDWVRLDTDENSPNRVVERIGDFPSVSSLMVVDVGSDVQENLSISKVVCQDKLVANKNVRFDVEVTNQGLQNAENFEVKLQVDDLPLPAQQVEVLKPGESTQVTFVTRFSGFDNSENEGDDLPTFRIKNYKVSAEIVQDGKIADSLVEDSVGYFAARVLNGISVLFVDGDPASIAERSNTHFLQSLDFEGSGLIGDTITVSELETVSLSNYKVIFLCNIDEAGEQRLESLKQWVEGGGGLVLMPGTQVRASVFNRSFFENGLSPVKLTEILGDSNKQVWKNFELNPENHPAMSVITDNDLGPFFEQTKVFSWWGTDLPNPDENTKDIFRISDEKKSIGMVEQLIGKGSVITFTMGADADWTPWPTEVSYSLTLLPTIEYLVGNFSGDSQARIGTAISYLVDLSRFSQNVSLLDPANEKVQASADVNSEEGSIMKKAVFDQIDRRGIYKLNLNRMETDATEQVYFAVNVDPTEGDLKRLDFGEVGQDFFGDKVQLVNNGELGEMSFDSSSDEFWWQLLFLLAAFLGLEQLLGWWFGRRR